MLLLKSIHRLIERESGRFAILYAERHFICTFDKYCIFEIFLQMDGLEEFSIYPLSL